MKKSIKFDVELDENNLPINITMHASDSGVSSQELKALMISAWDAKNKETLRIDLWTKDMPVEDMKMFFYQTLSTMTDTYERATQDIEVTKAMKEFCNYFSEKLKLSGE